MRSHDATFTKSYRTGQSFDSTERRGQFGPPFRILLLGTSDLGLRQRDVSRVGFSHEAPPTPTRTGYSLNGWLQPIEIS